MNDVAEIESTYENVHATCPHCGQRNIFNQVSDLHTGEPIAGREVTCDNEQCGRSFWITSDRINPAHQALLFDCRELLARKQYMQCVLVVAQSYEVFFSHFMHVQVLYRAFAREDDEIEKLNELLQRLQESIQHFTFEPMRSLFLELAVSDARFANLTDAEAWIDALPKSSRRVPKPTKATIQAVANPRLRDGLLALYDTNIARLRNRVVHKDAYRPTREETEEALREAGDILHPLTRELRLGGTQIEQPFDIKPHPH